MYVFASACAHFHQLNADNGVEDLATMTLHLSDRSLATISLVELDWQAIRAR